ncbi:unnamed protein product [Trifolium pratense]|uniref:Uncharacterized protein n=1 Tax=Trifolium pratense TaxID=57577 RepID=A0ACB0J2D0_TRIPR|nr:unnamed protein product [Trifolium pratense]
MLLRNIDVSSGLCNGTRLIVTHLGFGVVGARVVSGRNIGSVIFIPRMRLLPSDATVSICFQCLQFPLCVCFAMSINKSQGQTLSHVGLYLPRFVFTHGQLYVALSRVRTRSGLKVMVTDGNELTKTSTLMETHGVNRLSLVGISYGGFVGYSLAAQFPEVVEKLVLCCAGVYLEEIDMKNGLFKVSSLEEASSILLPQTPDKLRELMRLSFVRPARVVPSWFLEDFIHVMCKDHIEQKRELLEAILKDRQLSNLPKINKPTLIMWGEQDQVFPLELGYRLKRHIGENTQMVIIKNAGHALNIEKPKEFARHLKSFLINGDSRPSSPPSLKEQIQKTFSFDFIRYWSGWGALAWGVALLLLEPIFETKLFVMLLIIFLLNFSLCFLFLNST